MPPMTWDEVYEMYCFMGAPEHGSGKGSAKLLRRVFKACWEPILGFRHIGQHARCSTCARLAKTRRDSPDLAERETANMEYKVHLQGVFAMRRVDMRFSRMSAASCEPGCIRLTDACTSASMALTRRRGAALATSRTASNGRRHLENRRMQHSYLD